MRTPFGELEPGEYVFGDTVVSVSEHGWTETPGNPPAIVIVSPAEFRLLFTQPERLAIFSRAQTDPVVADFVDAKNSVTEIHLDSQELAQGIAYLVSVGLLEEARASQILSGVRPS